MPNLPSVVVMSGAGKNKKDEVDWKERLNDS